MIGTHSAKTFNAQLKQEAISARITGQIPESIICSKTVCMDRELWAMPLSAANISTEKAAIESAVYMESLPDLTDSKAPQILLPTENWQDNNYISITPAPSCGVLDIVNKKLADHIYHKKVIQPNFAAWANHGELILQNKGALKLFKRGCANNIASDWQGNFVLVTAIANNINIASGMIAAGWPAISAIGGAIHSLERDSGLNIKFAFGMEDCSWSKGVKLGSKLRGREVIPSPVMGEITANASIVLLLQGDDLNKIAESAEKLNKLAGGSLFHISISIENGKAPDVNYLSDASNDILDELDKMEFDGDSLDAAFALYKKGDHTLNHAGYGLLEEPKDRAYSRDNYPHAWAEPLFSCVCRGELKQNSWWKRVDNKYYTLWKSVND